MSVLPILSLSSQQKQISTFPKIWNNFLTGICLNVYSILVPTGLKHCLPVKKRKMWNESLKFSYRLFGAGLITLKLFVFCDDHGSSVPASSMINKVKTNRKDSWVCDDKETTSSQQQSPLLCRSEAVQLSHVQHLLLYKRQLKGAHAPPHGLQAFQMSLLWAPLQNVRPPQNPHPMPLQAK